MFIGRFQLLGRIAAGGMAEVHLARTGGAGGFSKVVVLKRILPNLASNPEFTALFLNEARLMAQLSHSNIVESLELAATARPSTWRWSSSTGPRCASSSTPWPPRDSGCRWAWP